MKGRYLVSLAVLAVVVVVTFGLVRWMLGRDGMGEYEIYKKGETLAKYEEQLKASELSAVYLNLTRGKGTDPMASKVGGSFYLPKGQAPPLDQDGKVMMLLVQVNFAEMPPLSGYPEDGILQVFLCAHDPEFYGCELYYEPYEFDSSRPLQERYRVKYYFEEEVDAQNRVTDFSFLPEMGGSEMTSVLEYESTVTFSEGTERVQENDYRFGKIFGYHFFRRFGDDRYNAFDDFWQAANSPCRHKIGGYLHSAQGYDTRSYLENFGEDEDWLLLLEFDSDDGFSWGDAGVGNFFIRAEDLAARDFSRVVYDWDCY